MSAKSRQNRRYTTCNASHGLTLVELMVAMAIGLLIVLAAVAVLTASRRGASTVDTASQLRDDARFATSLIQRLAVQTGFEDMQWTRAPYSDSAGKYKLQNGVDINDLKPNVYGYDNSIPSASDPINTVTTRVPGALGYGSDILILQYQTAAMDSGSGTDESMISCDGWPSKSIGVNRSDRLASIFYVAISASSGQPALMCIKINDDGKFSTPTPLIDGVENFQILYGVDNVVPNTAPTGHSDGLAKRYLRASQLTVPGNDKATDVNWRRVNSLRIGLVLRGPVGSAQETSSQTTYPLGSPNLSSASDPGATYTTNDSRLRQTVNFTIHLRNCQNQGYQTDASTSPCDVEMPS
ncbi:MAG: hypothetical protein BGO13_01590 [Burkholderiales bacterium 66-5]|nr:MAG: hypothetical protein BGO13_01590 [Burkholderiales bacterium 66-5]